MSGDAASRPFGQAADPAFLRCQKFTSQQIAFTDSQLEGSAVIRRPAALACAPSEGRLHRLYESSIAASGFINEDE
jgi:hypothetical protein